MNILFTYVVLFCRFCVVSFFTQHSTSAWLLQAVLLCSPVGVNCILLTCPYFHITNPGYLQFLSTYTRPWWVDEHHVSPSMLVWKVLQHREPGWDYRSDSNFLMVLANFSLEQSLTLPLEAPHLSSSSLVFLLPSFLIFASLMVI